MKQNEGMAERAVRIIIGLALLAVAFFDVVVGRAATVAYVLGTLALLTGLLGYCPAWPLLGINTAERKHLQPKAAGARK